jgi:hypothetical protein
MEYSKNATSTTVTVQVEETLKLQYGYDVIHIVRVHYSTTIIRQFRIVGEHENLVAEGFFPL